MFKIGSVAMDIGRGSDFFGPGVYESALGERILGRAVASKAAQGAGDLDLPHTYTYIDDFGKALAVLGERDEALGQVWHVPNPETITTREVIALIYAELGKPPRMNAVVRTMLRIVGVFVPGARETVEMLYEFEEPFVVDNSKYVQTFGNHATPIREAIRQTVAWYKLHPYHA